MPPSLHQHTLWLWPLWCPQALHRVLVADPDIAPRLCELSAMFGYPEEPECAALRQGGSGSEASDAAGAAAAGASDAGAGGGRGALDSVAVGAAGSQAAGEPAG